MMKSVKRYKNKRKARNLWVQKLEKLHASLRGCGINIPAEQLLRKERER
jgi:hypothetical protein